MEKYNSWNRRPKTPSADSNAVEEFLKSGGEVIKLSADFKFDEDKKTRVLLSPNHIKVRETLKKKE